MVRLPPAASIEPYFPGHWLISPVVPSKLPSAPLGSEPWQEKNGNTPAFPPT
jgi:hypothetical protein